MSFSLPLPRNWSSAAALLVGLVILGSGGCARPGIPGKPSINNAVNLEGEKEQQIPAEAMPAESSAADIIDCAALLAVRESARGNELKSGTAMYDRVTFALGKAAEKAGKDNGQAMQVKMQYAEKTMEYFGQEKDAPEKFLEDTESKAVTCNASLSRYEPSTSFQDAINEAIRKAQ